MPANGSSSSMNDGEMTRARVISSRRRSPPDSENALFFARRAMPSSSRSAPSRLRRCSAPRSSVSRMARMFCSTVSLRKIGRFLRQVADAAPRALVHRQPGEVLTVQEHLAAVGMLQADDHVKARRLAGAVRPEQADDLAGAHLDADTLDDGATAERLREPLGSEERCAGAVHCVVLGAVLGTVLAAVLVCGLAAGLACAGVLASGPLLSFG